jgi:hypothetical protein
MSRHLQVGWHLSGGRRASRRSVRRGVRYRAPGCGRRLTRGRRVDVASAEACAIAHQVADASTRSSETARIAQQEIAVGVPAALGVRSALRVLGGAHLIHADRGRQRTPPRGRGSLHFDGGPLSARSRWVRSVAATVALAAHRYLPQSRDRPTISILTRDRPKPSRFSTSRVLMAGASG